MCPSRAANASEQQPNSREKRQLVDRIAGSASQACGGAEPARPGHPDVRREFPPKLIPEPKAKAKIVDPGANTELLHFLDRRIDLDTRLYHQPLRKQHITCGRQARGDVTLVTDEQHGLHLEPVGRGSLKTEDGKES